VQKFDTGRIECQEVYDGKAKYQNQMKISGSYAALRNFNGSNRAWESTRKNTKLQPNIVSITMS
jgi:hypothetical protein